MANVTIDLSTHCQNHCTIVRPDLNDELCVKYKEDNFAAVIALLKEETSVADFFNFDFAIYSESLSEKLSQFTLRFYFTREPALAIDEVLQHLANFENCTIVFYNIDISLFDFERLVEWQMSHPKNRKVIMKERRFHSCLDRDDFQISRRDVRYLDVELYVDFLLSLNIWEKEITEQRPCLSLFVKKSKLPFIKKMFSGNTKIPIRTQSNVSCLRQVQYCLKRPKEWRGWLELTDACLRVDYPSKEDEPFLNEGLTITQDSRKIIQKQHFIGKSIRQFDFPLTILCLNFYSYGALFQNLRHLSGSYFLRSLKSLVIYGSAQHPQTSKFSEVLAFSASVLDVLKNCNKLERLRIFELPQTTNLSFPVAFFSRLCMLPDIKEWTFTGICLNDTFNNSDKLSQIQQYDPDGRYDGYVNSIYKTPKLPAPKQ